MRRAPVLRSRREEVPCEVFARQRRCRCRRSNRASSRSRTLVRNDHRDLQSVHGARVHPRRKRAAARPGGARPSSRGQVASQGRCRIRPDGDNENPNCLVAERDESRGAWSSRGEPSFKSRPRTVRPFLKDFVATISSSTSVPMRSRSRAHIASPTTRCRTRSDTSAAPFPSAASGI